MSRSLILIACAVGIILAVLAVQSKPDTACVRLQAKLDLSDQFCKTLSLKMAEDRCSGLLSQYEDDGQYQEVLGQCLRAIVPAAHSACENYIQKEAMKKDLDSLCR